MQKLLILGAGGYGRTVAEAAAGQFETAFLDDASPLALAPCARYAEFVGEYAFAYPAFGDNALRAQWLQKLKAAGFRLPVLRHAQSFVSPSAGQRGAGHGLRGHVQRGGGGRHFEPWCHSGPRLHPGRMCAPGAGRCGKGGQLCAAAGEN